MVEVITVGGVNPQGLEWRERVNRALSGHQLSRRSRRTRSRQYLEEVFLDAL